MRCVDSHCHIDMPEFDADRDAVVETMLIVGGVDENEGHRRALGAADGVAVGRSSPARRCARPSI